MMFYYNFSKPVFVGVGCDGMVVSEFVVFVRWCVGSGSGGSLVVVVTAVVRVGILIDISDGYNQVYCWWGVGGYSGHGGL